MGMFNTVLINCPHCGVENDEQTKNGSCTLNCKPLVAAEAADVQGVSGYPIDCLNCGEKFIVKNQIFVKAWVEKYEDKD